MLDPKTLITHLCSKQQINCAPFDILSQKLIFLQNNLKTSQNNFFISKFLNHKLIQFYKNLLKVNTPEKIFVLLESFLNEKEIKEIYNYFYYFVTSDFIIELLNQSITKSVELWMIYGCYKNNTIIKKNELEFNHCSFDHKFMIDEIIPEEYREVILKGGIFLYFSRVFFPNKVIFDTNNYNFTNFNNIFNIYQNNYINFNNYFYLEIKKEINKIKKYILMTDESKINEFITNKCDYPLELTQEESITKFFNLQTNFTYEFDLVSVNLNFNFLKIFLSKSNLKELKMVFRILLLIYFTKRKCDRISSFIIEKFINEINFKTNESINDVYGLVEDLKERITFVLRTFMVLSDKFDLILELINCILENKDLNRIIHLISKEDLPLGLKIFFEEYNYNEYCKGDVN